eukprot:1143847-Pelagomonas_calceolata.AAC.9
MSLSPGLHRLVSLKPAPFIFAILLSASLTLASLTLAPLTPVSPALASRLFCIVSITPAGTYPAPPSSLNLAILILASLSRRSMAPGCNKAGNQK